MPPLLPPPLILSCMTQPLIVHESTTPRAAHPAGRDRSPRMLNGKEFAAERGVNYRTVKGWLADGKVVGAVKGADGSWSIPSDAPLRIGSGSGVERAAARAVVEAVDRSAAPAVIEPSLRLNAVLGGLVPLEDVARVLGTTTGGIKRLGAAGHLAVGKFGPRGSWRVFVPPVNR